MIPAFPARPPQLAVMAVLLRDWLRTALPELYPEQITAALNEGNADLADDSCELHLLVDLAEHVALGDWAIRLCLLFDVVESDYLPPRTYELERHHLWARLPAAPRPHGWEHLPHAPQLVCIELCRWPDQLGAQPTA